MPRYPSLLLLLSVAFMGAGCETTSEPTVYSSTPVERASAHPDTLSELNEATRKRILMGVVAPGDAVDLAFIAFGEPDRIDRVEQTDGPTLEIWHYGDPSLGATREEIVGYEGQGRNRRPIRQRFLNLPYQLIVREGIVISLHGSVPRLAEPAGEEHSQEM